MSPAPPTSATPAPPPSATAPPGAATPARTTGDLARLLGADLAGRADLPIHSLQSIDRAGPGSLTFIRSARYAAAWPESKAAAALVTRSIEVPGHDPATRALLLVDDADLALARVLELFTPPLHAPERGVHPSACVHPSAAVGAGAAIGPHCVVGPRARVGEHCVLHAGVFLGADVHVGPGTVLHAGVRILDRCTVGAQCILWPGVVIGADGFGYRPAPGGRGLVKIPHAGHVEIGHQVEIGANSCVDRGKFGATTIGDGTKIDNLCQIGHNCSIGRAVIICGMTGIAGSVTIGDGAILAGHVGIADNLTIGPRATIAAKSALMNDVPAGETWFGYPAQRHRDMMRSLAVLRDLPDLARTVRRLQRRIEGDGDGDR
jgi:UDP-3-O-[3-hydroxymyristoyl] glucosamine N-acyltransferase